MGYEVPVEVKRMRRRERIAYYTEKVRKEEPAYALLEKIESFLTDDQLEYKIKEVKELQNKVTELIKLIEGSTFASLLSVLSAQVHRISRLRQRRITLVARKFRKHRHWLDNEIQRIKDSEELAVDKALDIELQIIDICDIRGLDPIPFLLVHKVVGDSYVAVEKQDSKD